MKKILIADDHQLFNDGMKMMLAAEGDIDIMGQVFSGKDVLHAVHTLQPDLLLLDINMPHQNGLEVAEKMRQSYPAVRIIMLTMYSDRKFVDDCKRLGVPGYILKNSGVDEVLNAIETVLAGQRYYDPKLTKSTNPDQHADDSFQRQFQLTKRELEIIGLTGQSFTNEEIANRLFLSLATVKTHRNNINLKLGIKQPTDLVRFAIEHGLA